MEKMMWAAYMCMTKNMWGDFKDPFNLDDKVWDESLEFLKEQGYNTIVLDIGDGMEWKSHPEISLEGAWSQERMKVEIKKAADMGLTIIPKINFSTTHDCWLGDYQRMVSTEIYYTVCKDLIKEVCEVFGNPEYVHIGMDEEGHVMAKTHNFVCYRQHDLLWHDLKFLCNCVKENGATPWIWADFMINHPEDFRKHFTPDEIILSPWQYYSMYEEHFTPITNTEAEYIWYTTGVFKNSGFKYIEEDPICANYRKEVIPAMEDGFKVVPTTSTCFNSEYNHDDTLRWFKEKAPQDKIIGFMDAPWTQEITNENMDKFKESVSCLIKSRGKYYK